MDKIVLGIIGGLIGFNIADFFVTPYRKINTLFLNFITIVLIILNYVILKQQYKMVILFIFVTIISFMLGKLLLKKISLQKFMKIYYRIEKDKLGYTINDEYINYKQFIDLAIILVYLDKKYGYNGGFTTQLFTQNRIWKRSIFNIFKKLNEDERIILNDVFKNEDYLEIIDHTKFEKVFFESLCFANLNYIKILNRGKNEKK